ncbi:MAG TPA: hypothetical protein VII78_17910 [Myxococcota bacterium]
MRNLSKSLAAAVAAVLLAGPVAAENQFNDVEASHTGPMFDVLVMRPIGLIGLGVGAVLWLPAAAMTAAIQPTELNKPTEYLLKRPYRYVFDDPIGSH